jgi:hypothetical protein
MKIETPSQRKLVTLWLLLGAAFLLPLLYFSVMQ